MNLAVLTAFNARDNITPAFDAMGRGAKRFEEHASTAFRNSTKHGYDFQAIVKGILAANLIRGSIGAIGAGVRKVGGDFLQFDDIMLGAASRFDEIGPKATNLAEKLTYLKQQTRQAVQGSRFQAVDAAKAVNELAKAGYDVEPSLKMLPQLMAFATAGQEDLAEATTMSSDILGAFGLRSKNAQEQIQNHILLNDKLTKASLLSTGGLRDLYETLQTTAPLSKELRMSQDEVLALSVLLTNAGIKGTEAATALKRASLNIYAATGGMAEELKANGINVFDPLTGQARKFSTIIGEIWAKLKPLRDEHKLPIIRDLLGMYGLGGGLKIMQGFDQLPELEAKLRDAKGVTEDVANLANSSPLAKLVMLGNAAMEVGFKVLDAFAGKGKRGVEALTESIKKFDVTPLVGGLQATLSILTLVYQVLKPFLPIMPYIIAGFLLFNGVLKVMAFARVVQGIWLIGSALVAGLGPIGAFTTAWGALTAAIALNPIGLIAIGVTLAILAIVALERKFHFLATAIEYWRDKFLAVFNKVKEFMDWAFPGYGIMDAVPEGAPGVGSSQPAHTPGAAVVAPNQKEAEARQSTFNGLLTIAGAPTGSTLTQSTLGAPALRVDMLGAN